MVFRSPYPTVGVVRGYFGGTGGYGASTKVWRATMHRRYRTPGSGRAIDRMTSPPPLPSILQAELCCIHADEGEIREGYARRGPASLKPPEMTCFASVEISANGKPVRGLIIDHSSYSSGRTEWWYGAACRSMICLSAGLVKPLRSPSSKVQGEVV